MCWLYVAAVPRARGVVKKTHDLLIRPVVKRWDVRGSAIRRMTPVIGHHDDYGHDNDADDDVCPSSRRARRGSSIVGGERISFSFFLLLLPLLLLLLFQLLFRFGEYLWEGTLFFFFPSKSGLLTISSVENVWFRFDNYIWHEIYIQLYNNKESKEF